MTPKFVRESISELSELALPNDANVLGNVLGGKVMHLVDLAAYIDKQRNSAKADHDKLWGHTPAVRRKP